MRKHLKDKLEQLGWKLGEGSAVATKKVAGKTIAIEYHRTKGYFVCVMQGKNIVGTKWGCDFLETAIDAGDTFEKILTLKSEPKEAKPKTKAKTEK